MLLSSSSNINKPIAPKMSDDSTITSSTTRGCRRKITFHPTLGYAIPPPLPAKVARRNARERNRVKNVNSGFEVLRTHIPSAAKQKKMSKVETLRHAVEYIQSLQRMLMENSTSQEIFQYPATPLTPKTPSNITDFSSSCVGGFNESGYETGYYSSSSSSNSLVSPTVIVPMRPDSACSSSIAASSGCYQQAVAATAAYGYYEPSVAAAADNNSEEDELLDVIAKWQDQDD